VAALLLPGFGLVSGMAMAMSTQRRQSDAADGRFAFSTACDGALDASTPYL